MKEAFIKLHLSIFIAGFTGVFGKLITLPSIPLVGYRMVLSSVILFICLLCWKKLRPVSLRDALSIGGVGILLCLHWIFFYASIKTSNISIGVVCFSLVCFFTALLEPPLTRRKLSWSELGISLLTLLGILLIFSFDTRYRTGITLGVISSLLAALFTIYNKRIGVHYPASTSLLYEMIGGALLLTAIMPVYCSYFASWETVIPDWKNWIYILLFVLFCTIILYILQIQVLKKISAFTVNLNYNLEPIYSIVIAMLFFGEAKELHFPFYAGISLIFISILLQMKRILKEKK